MSAARVTSDAGTAAVVIPAGGAAAVVAAALGRYLDSVPAGCGRDRTVVAVHDLLVAVEGMTARGLAPAGCDSTTPWQQVREQWISAADFAERAGVTPAAVTQRCRRGHLPGAKKVGRQWLIPTKQMEAPQ